jgi:hypothetical protein
MTDGALTRVEFTEGRLERAKRNLATVDVVGVQERFDDVCDELGRRFGLDLGEPARVNRTEPAPATAGLVARIASDNAMDLELYRFAVSLLAERETIPPSGDLRGP